ncbi:ion transporter [Noviherbaspirillum sp. ST9]|uniref:ion transporter n=1 Tax=Noviherbaspirillum sp. ST9 TaxID=3401606 RepID=UPI003B588DA8
MFFPDPPPGRSHAMKTPDTHPDARIIRFALARNRLAILRRLEAALEIPMAVLGVVWLVFMVVELVYGLGTAGATAVTAIWVVFIADFLLRFAVAPSKGVYLRRNWLTAIALLLPALRMLRFARIFRTLARLRGVQLVRILTSVNRGMKSLGNTMQRRGFGYVFALTLIVTLAGAAGMLYFERDAPGSGLTDFWSALWWTAMIVTTMGSESWPKTPEGRALCLFLAIYAFAVFGYVTGTIATYFIDRDAAEGKSETADRAGMDAMRAEIAELRQEIRALRIGKQ